MIRIDYNKELHKFSNPDFIPDDDFCNGINDSNPNLNMLRFSLDGLICFIHSEKKEYYIELIENTANKFLKLVYFEYIKKGLTDECYYKTLNNYHLVPLYFNVAMNILVQENKRYKPRWLLEEYIKLSHKVKISNQDMFDNVGKILQLVLEKQKDPSGILKTFIKLDGNVLRSASIPNSVFNAIDYWVDEVFYGNVTTDLRFTDNILIFYEKMNKDDEIKEKRNIFATKYLNFFKTKVDNEEWDEDYMQSMGIKRNFLDIKLQILQKYCSDRDELCNDVRCEIDRINKLIPRCNYGSIPLSGGGKIPNNHIEKILEPFKNDSPEQIINKIILSDCFLPIIPRGISSVTGFLPTIYFSDGNVKKFDGGKQISTHGASDILAKWVSYECDWNFRLFLFQRLTDKFDKDDLSIIILSSIQYSEVINEVSKKMFQHSLKSYFNENYFDCIQSCVFQIESILREICIKNNIETISIEENKERQRSIRPLIAKLKDIVNEKTLIFIEWLLLDEEDQISKNYRNVIAHGLDSINQFNDIFTKDNALSIILIYLSLSKYGLS